MTQNSKVSVEVRARSRMTSYASRSWKTSFGGGTLVGNPGKAEQAFRDLVIHNY